MGKAKSHADIAEDVEGALLLNMKCFPHPEDVCALATDSEQRSFVLGNENDAAGQVEKADSDENRQVTGNSLQS